MGNMSLRRRWVLVYHVKCILYGLKLHVSRVIFVFCIGYISAYRVCVRDQNVQLIGVRDHQI
jgi:hypothetical protein